MDVQQFRLWFSCFARLGIIELDVNRLVTHSNTTSTANIHSFHLILCLWATSGVDWNMSLITRSHNCLISLFHPNLNDLKQPSQWRGKGRKMTSVPRARHQRQGSQFWSHTNVFASYLWACWETDLKKIYQSFVSEDQNVICFPSSDLFEFNTCMFMCKVWRW